MLPEAAGPGAELSDTGGAVKIYLSNSALYVLMRLMDIFNWWGMLILLL